MASARTTRGTRNAHPAPRPFYHFGWASWLWFIANEGERAQTAVRAFGQKLTETDPANTVYEMDWSNKYFDAAAKADLDATIIACLGSGMTAVQIRQQFEREVSMEASQNRQSTSPTSNLMQTCKLVAKASFLRDHREFGLPTKAMQLKVLLDEVIA
jgi:hypothetical protein